MNIVLWVVQGLLALAFLLAGFMKTFMPVETLKKNMAWVNSVPAAFVRFIGVSEILGAIGLILPAITGIGTWLTMAAAAGLVMQNFAGRSLQAIIGAIAVQAEVVS